MRRFTRLFALMLCLALVVALTGCGAGGSTNPSGNGQNQGTAQPDAPKQESKHLLIWGKLTEPEEAELLKVAEAWAAQNGHTVELVHFDGGYQEFATAAQAGEGPDIWIGMPHDNLGTFWKANLIAEVPAGVINTADFVPVALSASSLDGKLVAVPFTMEAVALFINTDKVSQVPASFDELIARAKEPGIGFTYDIANFYFTFGFIAGHGGYVFKESGGALDPKDVGLGTPEAVAGLTLVGDLVNKHKLVAKDVNYDIANGLFTAGEAAFMINGPWAVGGYKEAGRNFTVVPMPPLPGGETFKPFVGVQTAIVSAKSRNQAEAWELLKHLSGNTAEQLLTTGSRIPVLKAELEKDYFKNDKLMAAFAASAANGTPMPNIPEMSQVWTPAGEMISLVIQGQADPSTAAGEAVNKINNAIAGQQ